MIHMITNYNQERLMKYQGVKVYTELDGTLLSLTNWLSSVGSFCFEIARVEELLSDSPLGSQISGTRRYYG